MNYEEDGRPDQLTLAANNIVTFVMAEAATEEPSGFFAGETPLTMAQVVYVLSGLLNDDRIGIIGIIPEAINGAAISAGTCRLNGKNVPVFAVRNTLIETMTPEGVNAKLREMVDQGLIVPQVVAKKLYGLVEKEVVWE